MTIELIRADTENIEQVSPLFSAYRHFYQQKVNAKAELEYLTKRLVSEQCVIFVAKISGDIAGFVLLYPGFDSVMLSSVWTLHDLYVAPECRRKGVGRALMKKAEAFCRDKSARRIDLSTAVTNVVAQPLYESLGYERDEEYFSYSLNL